MEINAITDQIIGAAIEVHKAIGPGLLESAYEACLCHEFGLRGLSFERQKPLAVTYKEIHLDCSYRIDILVENTVVIELKCADHILPIHKAQLLTYLRLGGWKTGLILNFHVPKMVAGIHRLVFNLDDASDRQFPVKKIRPGL